MKKPNTIQENLIQKLLVSVAVIGLLVGTATVIDTSSAYAQDYTTGLMRGTVQDTSGAVIANATVVVTSKKGINSTITTNALGQFRLMQLPGDIYVVGVSKDGYISLDRQYVKISVGKDTAAIFTMASASGDIEEIIVTGTAQGNWDFNSTTTGISVDVDELIAMVPVDRNINSIALLTPGSSRADNRFGNVASFNGSSAGENIFYINGFNITDVSNMINGVTVPFEMYQSVDVKTGGYSAEFGRSTGGVINAVTKSGSNEFHGGANIFYEPNFARSQSPNVGGSNNSHNTDSEINYNLWASGPIIKDKLFFYAMYNPRTVTAFSYGQTQAYDYETKDPFYGIKLDFTPLEGHRFEYTRFDTSTETDVITYDFNNSGILQDDIEDPASLVGSEKGTSFFRGGGEVDILRYTGVLTDWFTVSGMWGKLKTDSTAQSTADSLPVIYHYNEDGNFIPMGGWVNFQASTKTESREAWRVDADLYFNFGGEHHIRVGYDNEDMNLTQFTVLSGDTYYLYWTGDYPGTAHDDALGLGPDQQFVRIRDYSNGGSFNSNQTAWYIQDSWQVTDDLTVNVGLRNETFRYSNANDEVFIDTKNQLAIRAGFSYDVNGEGNSRLYGSVGRYHLPIAINTAYRFSGSETYIHNYYLMDGIGGGGVPQYDRASLFATDIFANGEIPEVATLVDANVKPMYSDEFILGYEYSFDNGWTMGARFMHRYIGRLMEDVAIDAAVIQWAEQNGYGDVSDIWAGFHQYVITNPGNDMTVSTFDLPGEDGALVEMNLSAADLNYPEGKRSFTSLDIEFRREWDGLWFLQGSYTLSRSYGNYEGNIKSDNGQTDAGITTDFDQPGLTDGAEGKLPNNRMHRFKAWGSYQLTDYLLLGARVDVESGRLQGCLGIHPTDDFAAAYGSASWYCDLDNDGTAELIPRGTLTSTGWTANIDLSAAITPDFVKSIPGDMQLRVDVFNVFNSHNPSRLYESGTSPYFGDPAGYQTPRSVRFSAIYKF